MQKQKVGYFQNQFTVSKVQPCNLGIIFVPIYLGVVLCVWGREGEGLWERENQIDIISNTDDKNRCSRATFKKIKEKWSSATSSINLIQFSEKKTVSSQEKNQQ